MSKPEQEKYPRLWEKVNASVNRIKVFGGWLVNDFEHCESSVSSSICFIPDPQHRWILETEGE